MGWECNIVTFSKNILTIFGGSDSLILSFQRAGIEKYRGVTMAVVTKSEEHYLINNIGLTKGQIKEMYPSQIKEYGEKVIQERIKDRGIYTPVSKSEMGQQNKA